MRVTQLDEFTFRTDNDDFVPVAQLQTWIQNNTEDMRRE